MKTFKRVCIHDYVIKADGDTHEVKRGVEYLTSDERSDGTIVVFGGYWTPFPKELFAGPLLFTDG